MLLALGDEAPPALLRRYAAAPAGELPRPRAVLEALCRTGTPFARAALQDLSSASGLALERGLAAAELLARHLRREGPGSRQARALEARHAHLVDAAAVEAGLLEAIRDRVATRLDAPDPRIREAAIRTAAALGDRARAPRIREALRAARLGTRVAAIRALALLSDTGSVERLVELARAGEREERLAALEALGHLGPSRSAPRATRCWGCWTIPTRSSRSRRWAPSPSWAATRWRRCSGGSRSAGRWPAARRR